MLVSACCKKEVEWFQYSDIGYARCSTCECPCYSVEMEEPQGDE